MTRRTLPAGGRDLVSMRNAGVHPWKVFVIIGPDCWERRPNGPALFVKHDEEIDTKDWSILSGLYVVVVWRGGDGLRLAATIAEYAAPVKVAFVATEGSWPIPAGTRVVEDICYLMPYINLPLTPYRDRWVRVDYWGDELERDYLHRSEQFYDHALGDNQEMAA